MKSAAVFLIGLLSACGGGHDSDQVPAPVGMVQRHYVDHARQDWRDDGPRPLHTTIWYPAASAAGTDTVWIGPPSRREFMPGIAAHDAPLDGSHPQLPMVLLSHGTGGSALQLMWLGQQLAARGYIVAAVNHHGNTAAEPNYTAQGFLLWWERASDLSAVVDAILADSIFGSRVDTARIGAAGFSLGGYTVIEIAGGRTDLAAYAATCRASHDSALCDGPPEFPSLSAESDRLGRDPRFVASMARSGASYRDPRIKAVFAIAPAMGGAFTSAGLAGITVPVSIVVGSADSIAPSAGNARLFADRIPGALLQIIPDVGHYMFLSECTVNGVADIPLLCRDPAGVGRDRIHMQVADSAAAFFGRHLLKH
jgi:predicted dienelactone hydrolase